MTTAARKAVWAFMEVFYVLSSVLQFPVAQGILTPDGTVSLYNGSQQTFTCNVTGPAAVWTISGLSGISVTGNIGLLAASNNPRITTTDKSGLTPSSAITITGFTAADNRGTIQCINQADGEVQGKAIISIGALTPGGSVSIYNGKQQTFTCSVSGAAAWTITGLRGITATRSTGLLASNNNPRITTTDARGITPSSTITITGFTAADNGGTIHCINLADGSVHGKANISIDMLTPDGIVPVYSGSTQTFTCRAPGKPLRWNITGLSGINIKGPFEAQVAAQNNPRITSNDTGGSSQFSVSVITIARFTPADNGGTIHCINVADGSVRGTATILIGGLLPGGSVSIYNGKQQTFTCRVATAAVWTISGLRGIMATKSTGLLVANNNARITTTDSSGLTPSSTITITGFTAADNGGTILCIELADGSVQGKTNISIDMLAPDGIVPVYCGSTQTLTCKAPGKPLGWNITGFRGINIPEPFRARIAALSNRRIKSNDTGGDSQVGVSVITISGFSAADNGGTIQCINMKNGSVQAMATILIESPLVTFNQAAVNVPVLEGGTAIFTCKPKDNNTVGLISWSLTSAKGVHTDINSKHPTVRGSSGLFLSPDRTQLLITGVRKSLNGTRVECGLANANAIFTSKCKESAYISVQSTVFTTVSPFLVLKLILPSRSAVVLVWSIPASVPDDFDGFVISVAIVRRKNLETIRQTTVGKQVRAYTVDFPEKGTNYQVTVHMTMNGLHSKPLTVKVNL